MVFYFVNIMVHSIWKWSLLGLLYILYEITMVLCDSITEPQYSRNQFFVRDFCSPFTCVILVCLLSCQGRFEVVSVACAKLVCCSHFYLFNLLWSHFHVAAHEAFVPRTECEDERWQQSLVDSVTVFIQLDSVSPDVALEDSHCKRGCLCMK